MKKKKLLSLCVGVGLGLAMLLTGCSSGQSAQAPTLANTPAPSAAPSAGITYQWDSVKKNDGINNLKAECDQKGTVVSLDYETPLYITDAEQTVTKSLYVYLPYHTQIQREAPHHRARLRKDYDECLHPCHRRHAADCGGKN